MKLFRISLAINAFKKNLWGNTFFSQSIPFWSSIWSSTVKVPFIFIDLCRFSIVDVPSSGPENIPKPRLPPYRSLYAVSSTCKEKTWDKCCESVRLALFTASLTKKCAIRNCVLSKWQCLHNETSVTRSI